LISQYLQRWNGSFFERTSLRDLGLIVHLGHQGKPCPFLGRVLDKFTVVHTNGIHTVRVRLCACHGYGDRSHAKFQLLRCSWLPASTEEPQTAFTFEVLDTYLLLSLQGKLSQEDYYLSTTRHTDNTGLDPPKVRVLKFPHSYADFSKERYREFRLAVRIWGHLMLLKRSGRAHELEGVDGTKPGQCAIECPVCPHPGRNIPSDWDEAPEDIKYDFSSFSTSGLRH
jgi:hypothetical protein